MEKDIKDMSNEFHNITLKSILFKGRNDIYFCYLKSERIAHVLVMLAHTSAFKDTQYFEDLIISASRLPHTLLHFVAGEIDAPIVLADILALLSGVRLGATQGYIRKENAALIAQEYEGLVQKIAAENHPSPFVSSKDFSVEEVKMLPGTGSIFSTEPAELGAKEQSQISIKDTSKGHVQKEGKQNDRMSLILDFVRKNKGVSIKEIAAVVRGCSEKTIQRELAHLIDQGLVERKGERRWSVYTAASKHP